MTRPLPVRGRLALAAAMVLALPAGCTGSSLGGSSNGADDEIRIGLLLPRSGPYKAIGDDQRAGWQAALEALGGRLGGRPVTVIEADEGDGRTAARAAGKKLLEQDKVTAIVGGATADTVNTLYPMLRQAGVPLIGIGGRPSTIEDPALIWHTSWLSQETGAAIADHLRTTVDGPVYVIGPDYIGGHDQIGGFVTRYTTGGGRLANPDGRPAWTPWAPTPTTDFEPYLSKIKSSGAKAVYAFYGGASAVEFVKQYRQFVPDDIPLYASGFLTEGAALAALGRTAKGEYTSLNYSTTLDNEANRQFVGRFTADNGGRLPNLYHVCAWDAALVLDKAVTEALTSPGATAAPTTPGTAGPSTTPTTTAAPAAAPGSGGLSPQALTAALARIGEIDSPRGGWHFGPVNHTPVQRYYLRQVLFDGRAWANVTLQELATLADWDCTWRDMIRRSPGRRATALLEMFQDALLGIAEQAGADLGWARDAPQAMLDLGLTEVTGHIDARSWTGGTGICLLHRSNSVQKEAELLAAGMSRDELVELRDVLMNPELMLSGYLMHTTVGRRPA